MVVSWLTVGVSCICVHVAHFNIFEIILPLFAATNYAELSETVELNIYLDTFFPLFMVISKSLSTSVCSFPFKA